MDNIENLMEIHPDSSLILLEAIDKSRLRGDREKARYALLMSMAYDKNYIDKTEFDVIQPAVDYYLKHGSPDEKMRTYYYQGRIYQNSGDDDSAMTSFIKASELNCISDSLLLARLLVAKGILYYKQYKLNNFIENNLMAAKIYGAKGKYVNEIKCYSKALDGAVVSDLRQRSDSLMKVCSELVDMHPECSQYTIYSSIAYTIYFGSDSDMREVLDKYDDFTDDTDVMLNIANGYSKIGEWNTALAYIDNVDIAEDDPSYLKYLLTKIHVLENVGDYREVIDLYVEYIEKLEDVHDYLITHDLLFLDKRHELEIKNLMEIQKRDDTIRRNTFGIIFLLITGALIYNRYRFVRTKRKLAEEENAKLKLMQENLVRSKEKIELEKVAAELELENLKLEKIQLEREQSNLKELLNMQTGLPLPVRNTIKERLDILNSLLAKEISENDSYAKPYKKWIESIHKNRDEFMNSTKLAFSASHPVFMNHLISHGLTEDEIKYICLYAIGLRGKEVGEYIQLKRHYNVSSAIRKKLGIDEHETNIGPYVRRLMNELG